MNRLKKASYFKAISIILIPMFFFEAGRLLAQNWGKNLEMQLQRAMYEYKSNDYKTAAIRLARLKAAIVNMNNLYKPDNEVICRQGQTLLLLGACFEKLNNIKDAEANYKLAKEILGRHFNKIKGLKLRGLPVYKKIKRSKVETDGNVVYVPRKKQKPD